MPQVGGGIGARSEQALLLAGPEGQADGAPRLDAEGLEQAHGLHRRRDPGRVVGRARAAVPGIEVGAEHDDLVGKVAAGQVGDDVGARAVVLAEGGPDVQLQSHRYAVPQQAHDAAEVLVGHGECGDAGGALQIEEIAVSDDEVRAAGAPARLDDRQCAFTCAEGEHLLLEAVALDQLLRLGRGVASAGVPRATSSSSLQR